MEDQELTDFVQRIWDTTRREEAHVRIGGQDEELEIIGNRVGLLRLAAECLTATYNGSDPAYLFAAANSDTEHYA